MRRVALLGSTGSIGRQTLELAARDPDRVRITALAAGSDLDALAAQARVLSPPPFLVALERPRDAVAARAALGAAAPGARIVLGAGAAVTVAREADAVTVVNAIVGAAGLAPTLATLDRGSRLALAN